MQRLQELEMELLHRSSINPYTAHFAGVKA